MKLFIVDAFTSIPFSGNPAAVCVMDKWISDDLMKMVAMECNLSETAFVVNGEDGYSLRWFTPVEEVDLVEAITEEVSFDAASAGDPVEEQTEEPADEAAAFLASGTVHPLIKAAAAHWELDRMASLDRIVLRIAMVELSYIPEIPMKVAITEAVQIAAKYSTDNSDSFVNGLLTGFMRNRGMVVTEPKEK